MALSKAMSGGQNRSFITMRARVDEYLALRHAFGAKLEAPGLLLQNFASFADQVAPGSPLTLELALRWAHKARGSPHTGRARRLQALRPFAQHLRALDGVSESITSRLVSPARRRPQPQIPTDKQLYALLSAAICLRPKGGLRPHTIATYLSLLLCTGMRPSEPLRLEDEDVDLRGGIITVRQTKFSKSRLIVLHPSASQALREYVRIRNCHVSDRHCGAFFLMDGGRPLMRQAAAWALRYACRRAGLRLTRRKHPRLYDMRHTFVCRRILDWYRQGINVEAVMPALSTYLGHVKVTDTYWYVTATPELMAVASRRFERYARGLPTRGDSNEDAE